MGSYDLKIPPLLVAFIFGAVMFLADVLFPFVQFSFKGNRVVSGGFLLLGVSVALAGVVRFKQDQTTVNPTTPDATSTLVTTGIYRISRNPMYLGFSLALLAWAVYLTSLLAYILIPGFVAYMNRFQITVEENALSEKFGVPYDSYKLKVRRWV